ncbi:MAG: Hsp20/alpha crystallin family protein [Planctomycetes bacterium]|nr:Hsp20/alpha crystallin family protein [Planctomycetota bacterium]
MTTLVPRLRDFSIFNNPFRPFNEIEELFRGLPDEAFAAPNGNMMIPAVEFVELPEFYKVKAELPGLEAKDIDIQINGDLLTLSGEKKEEKKTEQMNVHFTERRYGKWQRSFRLPASADPTRVEATMNNGVLDVTIIKRVEAKPQVIKVKTV